MVTSKETAEEQLLRMIEGPQGVQPSPTKPTPVSVLSRFKDVVQERSARVWRRLMPSRMGWERGDTFLWNLKLANRLLWIVLAGLGAYVVLDFVLVQPKPRVTRAAVLSSKAPAAATTPSVGIASPLKPLSEYLSAVTQRNPFTGKAGGMDQAETKTAKRRIEELASTLAVVGIDRGPTPVALIEDSAQKRTYVVKMGDEINGMIVKKISAEGVVVSYEGEELLLP